MAGKELLAGSDVCYGSTEALLGERLIVYHCFLVSRGQMEATG